MIPLHYGCQLDNGCAIKSSHTIFSVCFVFWDGEYFNKFSMSKVYGAWCICPLSMLQSSVYMYFMVRISCSVFRAHISHSLLIRSENHMFMFWISLAFCVQAQGTYTLKSWENFKNWILIRSCVQYPNAFILHKC